MNIIELNKTLFVNTLVFILDHEHTNSQSKLKR